MDRSGRFFLAFLLIAIGAFFTVINYAPGIFRADAWWPAFVVIPGVAMLAAAIAGRLTGSRSLAGLAVPGSILSTIGFILLYDALTGNWESWAYTWALIPASVGLGIYLSAKLGDGGGAGVGLWMLAGGLTAFAVFGLFFETLILRAYSSAAWAVLLMLAGGVLLLAELGKKR